MVAAASPSCVVDLGLDPREHKLELVRTDASGAVTDRAERWINRPGIEAEIFAKGACDPGTRQCEFSVAWAHPYRLDPKELTMRLDGEIVYHGAGPRSPVRAPFPGPAVPRLLICEAAFPDGRTAIRTDVLSAANRESAGASLRAVPILPGPDTDNSDTADQLRAAGWNVHAVEGGTPDVVFVIEPKALQSSAALLREMRLRGGRSAMVLRDASSIQLIVANQSLTRLDAYSSGGGRPAWLASMFGASKYAANPRRVRTADAVATAGYLLGASPRPRAIVLVLSGRAPDTSTLSVEQARHYLSEALVPLFVWRIGDAAAPEWPEDRRLQADHDLYDSLVVLSHDLGKQRIAWLDAGVEGEGIPARAPDGVGLAGRLDAETEPEFASAARAPDPSLPARSIFALAADPAESGRVLAGTDAGLFESRDGGDSWITVKSESGLSVYAVAFTRGTQGLEPLIGTSGRPARRTAEAGWTAFPTAEILAVAADPFEGATVYAGTRSGVLKSVDGGYSWSDSSRKLSRTFTLALAADPKRRGTLYAATAGDGVYRTTDHGGTWEPRGSELEKTVIRSLAVDPSNPDRIYAGTDGGLWTTRNAGSSWELAGTGLPRTPVYALALDPKDSTLWAGTARGLFRSGDAGRTWTLVASTSGIPVTSIAVENVRNLVLAGTLGSGLQRVPVKAASPAN